MEAYTGEIRSAERIADYSDHGHSTCGNGQTVQPLQHEIRLIFVHGLHLQLVVHDPLDSSFSIFQMLGLK